MNEIHSLKKKIEELTSDIKIKKEYILDEINYAEPSKYPRKDHPRVWVDKERLEVIKQNLLSPENKYAYADYINKSEMATSGILPKVTEESEEYWNYSDEVLEIIEAKAFRYMLTGEEIYGYEAIYAIINYLQTLDIWEQPARYTPGYMFDSYHRYGYTLLISAQVYDWCYQLLTDKDKEAIVSLALENAAANMEIGFPPDKQGGVTGHGSELQFLCDWVSFSVAVYDEYPDYYRFVMGRLEKDYVPFREFYFKSGMQSQGNSYGPIRFCCDLIGEYLVRVATGYQLFDVDMNAVARSFIHNMRPDDSLLRIGDDLGQRFEKYNYISYYKCMLFASAIYGDGIAYGEFLRTKPGGDEMFQLGEYFAGVKYLIVKPDDTATEGYDRLPLSLYNGSPVGQIIARTSWTDPDAVLLYMKIGEYYSANHEHKDCGQFQIFHRGILASDSGFYDAYFSPVDYGYTKSTLAHNCILIYDPDEEVTCYHPNMVNTGGQKSQCEESETFEEWLSKDQTKRAEEMGHSIKLNDDGSVRHAYISGDITNAYIAEKAKEVKRYMYGVFTGKSEMPLVFFVFDKVVSVNPDFKKTFLLHFEEEPEIDNTTVTISHKGGKLVNRTLLPRVADLNIELIEGSYVMGDVSPEITRLDDTVDSCEKGWGRIEISPKTPGNNDYFFNVMYVSGEEYECSKAEPILFESENIVGAAFAGCAVFFPKDGVLSDGTVVEISGEDDCYVSVAGAEAGTWNVTDCKGEVLVTLDAKPEEKLLTFTAPAGKYCLRRNS